MVITCGVQNTCCKVAVFGSFEVFVCVLLILALGNSFFCLAASIQLPFYFALCLANEWGYVCVHGCVNVWKKAAEFVQKMVQYEYTKNINTSDNTESTQGFCMSLILLQLRQSSLINKK